VLALSDVEPSLGALLLHAREHPGGHSHPCNGQYVYANIDQLVEETATHGGEIAFALTGPAIWY